MPINFDEINSAEGAGPAAKSGRFLATIEAAIMKQGKDTNKPMYLAVTYNLMTMDGKKAGKFWDNITEPTSDIPKFKLKRFIEACEIKGLTNFELKDLAKIVPGKTIGIDLIPDRNDPAKTVIDVFSGMIYYSPEDLKGTPSTETPEEDLLDFEKQCINGSDALDAPAKPNEY